MDDFDYIVVGAGSAGCVLASRLTEDGKSRVLLLEFGGSDRSILIQMPAALSIPMNMPKYNWGFATEPEPYLADDGWPRRAARCWGVRLRSTAWFGCAAIRSILTVGKNRAPRAGAIAMCCPISAAPTRTRAAIRNTTAATVRSITAMGTGLRMDDFDYIVVGAGSAGCVLASRLTEEGKSRVLLLEFGGSDQSKYD